MGDHHVDRPGVEVRQRMELTGTNNSIGLNHSHCLCSSGLMLISIVLADERGESRYPADGTRKNARRPLGLAGFARRRTINDRKVNQRTVRLVAHALFAIRYALFAFTSFSITCVSPTWWLWRGGCTRSLSEHGRETPQRRWYFVLRRGRVGRCQVCKTHGNLLKTKPKTTKAATSGLLS